MTASPKPPTGSAGHLNIVRRSDDGRGFTVLPRRWVVERTFAWLMHTGPTRPRLRTPLPPARRSSCGR
ncbi:transposase [Streptomyces zaomyceticus]|uniref:transposase n=1 Tax=Streptomyces zaomyceticus TaxID=68286 RepID=UPI00372006C3